MKNETLPPHGSTMIVRGFAGAADFLGCSESHVRNKVAEGDFAPVYNIGARLPVFIVPELIEWVRRHQQDRAA